MKKLILYFIIAIFSISCTGNVGNENNQQKPNNQLSELKIVAPSSYPSGTTIGKDLKLPIQVFNTGNVNANNISYSIIDQTSEGNPITIGEISNSCKNILANDVCSFTVNIPSNVSSGSFKILARPNGPSFNSMRKSVSKLTTDINDNFQSIGLINLPINNNSGVNGLNLTYPKIVQANNDGLSRIMINVIVNSPNIGVFNDIKLVSINGTKLLATVEKINNELSKDNYQYNSIATFLVTPDKNIDQLDFAVQILNNDVVVDTGKIIESVKIIKGNLGVLNVLPDYFNLDDDFTSQVVTLYNNGNTSLGGIKLLDLVNSAFIITNINCANVLESSQSCQYKVELSNQAESVHQLAMLEYSNHNNNINYPVTINYFKNNNLSLASDKNFEFKSTTSKSTDTNQITITNTGSEVVSNINFILPNYITIGHESSLTCGLNTVLNFGDSCTVNLVYTNSKIQELTIESLLVTYNYLNKKDIINSNSLNQLISIQTTDGYDMGNLAVKESSLQFSTLNSSIIIDDLPINIMLKNSFNQNSINVNLNVQNDYEHCITLSSNQCSISTLNSQCEVNVVAKCNYIQSSAFLEISANGYKNIQIPIQISLFR